MAPLRNKMKLAALNKENCDEHPRSKLAQNSTFPRPQEDYITQVSEEIEWGFTKKLSRVQYNRKPLIGCVITSWRLPHKPANSELLWDRSRDVPERVWHKPGNERRQLPEWSSSWSRHFSQPDDAKLSPRRWPRQTLRDERDSTHEQFWLFGLQVKVSQHILSPSRQSSFVRVQVQFPRWIFFRKIRSGKDLIAAFCEACGQPLPVRKAR